jgi:hypothetical protein
MLRNRRLAAIAWIFGVMIMVALVMILFLGNYRFCQQSPGGNDFLVHWKGTQVFIQNGISPYSDEAARSIQQIAYGRSAQPGEHELRVAYPFYSIFLFLPFSLINDFTLARAIWMTLLELALFSMTFLSIRLTGWKTNIPALVLICIFSLVWYHAVRPIINGNAVILVALGITACLLALKSNLDELAGALLALTTIKPQVVFVIVIFFIFWGIAKRKGRFLSWFGGTMLILVALGLFLLPDWLIQNLREIIRYPAYNPPGTPGAAFALWLPAIGNRLGVLLSVLIVVILLIEWWQVSRKAVEFHHLLWTVCLTMTLAQWIGIQTDPGNFIILFPVIVLIFSIVEERWRKGGTWIIILIILILLFGIWGIFLATVQFLNQPQQSPFMFFPLPGILIMLLYWVRYYAIRPPKVWIEQLHDKTGSL